MEHVHVEVLENERRFVLDWLTVDRFEPLYR